MIQENVKVMIVDGTGETSRIAKEMIQACDDIVVLGGPTQSSVYELHNFHRPMAEIYLEPQVKHGAYRKFIKHDKRKNFKVNK
jgi:hypothetical protein